MAQYIIKSIIGRIADGIHSLIDKGTIHPSSHILIYGLDRYAFAIRTILCNYGFHNVECFISEDEVLVLEHTRVINDFASRYLNDLNSLIKVSSVSDRLREFDPEVTILIASETYEKISKSLNLLGYKNNQHYYVVYDFVEPEIEDRLLGAKRLSLQEIKDAEKGILDYVDGFCERNKIRYWVCGGTLLGTIRHQGFIPWDDDIDIFMPWKDYLRFIAEFKETEDYSILGFGTLEENDYPDPLFKVGDKNTIVVENVGTVKKLNPVWIDVFPLIGLPDDEQQMRVYFADYQETNRQIWQDFYANNGDISVFGKWYKKQLAFLDKYDFDRAQYVGVLGTAYKDRDHTRRAVYNETLRMPFEDIVINVPAGYKEYLGNLYGTNYMQLPPEEKRKSHHAIEAYRIKR